MKRNILNKILIYIGCLIPAVLMSSCIEDFNADLGEADTNILVVEGNILSDTLCVFHLSKSAGINENVYPAIIGISNAKVSIIGTDGSAYSSSAGTKEGAYYIETKKLASDAKYSLVIEWDGATFTSEPSVPIDAPEIESMSVKQPRPDQQIDIMVTNVAGDSNKTNYCRWTYDDTWEVYTKYRPAFEYDPGNNKVVPIKVDKSHGWGHGQYRDIIIANSSKFQNNQVKDFRICTFDNSDLRFQTLYCINVKQYAMSRGQYEYELARQELSDQLGGMFAPQPSEMFSNIKSSDKKHRVIGYVGVCGKVSSFRFWVYRYEIEYNPILFRNIQITDDEEVLAKPNQEKYVGGYRVADDHEPMFQQWSWVNVKGVDATSWGCDLTKPSYWP